MPLIHEPDQDKSQKDGLATNLHQAVTRYYQHNESKLVKYRQLELTLTLVKA